MRRKIAIEIIKTEFATAGECTKKAMRVFIENRISKAAFDKAAREGLLYFNQIKRG